MIQALGAGQLGLRIYEEARGVFNIAFASRFNPEICKIAWPPGCCGDASGVSEARRATVTLLPVMLSATG